jgi:hypothetical protein
MPLFTLIYQSLADNANPSHAPEEQTSNIKRIRDILEIKYVDISFAYALIGERVSDVMKKEQRYIRWEDLKRNMINENIRLSERNFDMLRNSFIETNIMKSLPDGKIDTHLLMEVASTYVDRSHIPDPVTGRSDGSTHSTSTSSVITRVIAQIMPKWNTCRQFLISNNHQSNISENVLHHSLKYSGVMLAASDTKVLWNYFCETVGKQKICSSDPEPLLTVDDIDYVLTPSRNDFSSLSAIMREEHEPSHRNYSFAGEYGSGSNNSNHMYEVMSEPDVGSVIDDYAKGRHCVPRITSFPWQLNESTQQSNLRKRVLQSIARLSEHQQKDFVKILEIETRKSQNLLDRNCLKLALGATAVHLTQSELQSLWTEYCETSVTKNITTLLQWLQIQVNVEPPNSRPSTSLSDYRNNYANESSIAGNGKVAVLSSWQQPKHHNNEEIFPPTNSTIDEEIHIYPQNSECDNDHSNVANENNLNDRDAKLIGIAVNLLLNSKPQLALLFRRLGGGTGTVKGQDLSDALRASPFLLPLSTILTWTFVCNIAGVSDMTPPALVFLRFNDIVRYLDNYTSMTIAKNESMEIQSIRKKLKSSYILKGNKDLIIGSNNNLRQRLRNMRTRGQVTSWEGLPDIVSHNEFLKLMLTVDLTLTHEEIVFIHKLLNHNNSVTSESGNETGISMSSAINLFASLV